MVELNSATLLDAALYYAQRGLPVFPLHTVQWIDGKVWCSCAKPDCLKPGKHPATKHGLSDATTDLGMIRFWWKRDPTSNIGLRMWGDHKLVVIDVDPRHGGDITWLEVLAGRELITKDVLTGGGGHHLFFSGNGHEIHGGTDVLGRGVDVRAWGGYIVAPPSLHESGER